MSYEEYPVFAPMGEERLCAVVCAPVKAEIRDLGVVLLTGGNYTRSHRNRMWVRAGRELARRGFASIRVDYHGVGDSSGVARFDLEAPFDDDAVAAADFLQRAAGVSRVALVATCFGGRSAMAAAARHPDIVAATIFPVPLMVPRKPEQPSMLSRAKRRLQKKTWARRMLRRPTARRIKGNVAARRVRTEQVSPNFKRDLAGFVQRGRVHFVYGELAETLPELRQALAEVEPHLTAEQRQRIELEVVAGTELHRFQSLADQDIVVSRAVASVERAYASLGDRSLAH